MKKYNFNAGPSMLPREVIENTAKQILDFNGSGLSLMEISHRAKDFQPVVDEAVSLFKELLDIPEGYSRYLPWWWCVICSLCRFQQTSSSRRLPTLILALGLRRQ